MSISISEPPARLNCSAKPVADELLDKITADAVANDYLIPELYEPNSGEYAGVVPMVGYGAGAWQLSQLFKHNVLPPTFGVGFEACADRMVPGGTEMGGAEMGGTVGGEIGGAGGEVPRHLLQQRAPRRQSR